MQEPIMPFWPPYEGLPEDDRRQAEMTAEEEGAKQPKPLPEDTHAKTEAVPANS